MDAVPEKQRDGVGACRVLGMSAGMEGGNQALEWPLWWAEGEDQGLLLPGRCRSSAVPEGCSPWEEPDEFLGRILLKPQAARSATAA